MHFLFIEVFFFFVSARTFIESDKEVISGFSALGVSAIASRETMALIEKIVCQLHVPRMVYDERAEIVVVSKEASALRLKGYHQPKLH